MKLRQLIEITQLNKDDYDSFISYQIDCVSIFLDEDPDLLWDKDSDYILEQYNIISNILNNNTKSIDIIKIDGYAFKKLPFTKLTLGEFIDLDYYSNQDDGIIYIIMILYRLFNQENYISPVIFEEYGDYFEQRKHIFNDLDINDVLGVKNEFDIWKKQLYTNYKGLFEIPYEEEYDEEEDNSLSVQQMKRKEEQKKSFNWESTILSVVNDDITKVDDVLKMPIVLFFNLLSSIKLS